MKIRITIPLIAVAILVTGTVLAPGSAAAQPRPWTTVGSAGTVDEADLGIFRANRGVIWPFGAPPRHLNVRYNVVAVDGLFPPMDGYRLTVRYRDNGAGARVRLFLREYPLIGGNVNRMVFDSNAFPQLPGFQTQSVVACWPGWQFDFGQNAYFVDALISRVGAAGNPALGIIQIESILC